MSSIDIRKGKGVGYKDDQTGKICMIRCFKCGKENYAPTVATGNCAWCGHDANVKPKRMVKKASKYGPSPLKGAIKLLILQDQLRTQQDNFRKRHGGLK